MTEILTENQAPQLVDSTDMLDMICDGMKKNGLKAVFWTCGNRECRGVTWDHSVKPSIATCNTCGKTSIQSNREKTL